ncbi:protein of unknown function [Methanocaldococcus lauensis]|nr:protein of unknown function [Methanocaldococcus lauensis]
MEKIEYLKKEHSDEEIYKMNEIIQKISYKTITILVNLPILQQPVPYAGVKWSPKRDMSFIVQIVKSSL